MRAPYTALSLGCALWLGTALSLAQTSPEKAPATTARESKKEAPSSTSAAQPAEPAKPSDSAKPTEPAKATESAKPESKPSQSSAASAAKSEPVPAEEGEPNSPAAGAEAAASSAASEPVKDEQQQPGSDDSRDAEQTADAEPKAVAEKEEPRKAPEAKEPPPPDYSTLPQTYLLRHIDVAIGARLSSATHKGLEPYMYEPLTGEVVGRLSATVVATDPWVIAAAVQAGGFSRGDQVRETETNLSVMHFGAGLETRYHMHPRVFGYARVIAGAELAKVSFGSDTGGANSVAKDSNWAFFGDANLGVAVRFAGSSDGRKRLPRAWAFLEGGGRLATTHQAELELGDDGPNRAETIVLPKFATSGGMVSLGAMMTF